MPIEITNPEAYTVAPSAGFTPDRLGVRRVSLDVDRATNAVHASLIPCPSTADVWGPTDAPEVVSPDLVAEIAGADVETPEKEAERDASLAAIGRISADLVTVSGFLLWLRSR